MDNNYLPTDIDAEALPLISVVLPVYNGELYVSEAIDSILAQTFKNFELIIIDDGSTDDSLSILKRYQQRDKRIRLIARENKNLASTLNDLIHLARGIWIARMDQDDISLPHRFERQLQRLEQAGADICGTWAQFFGSKDRRILKHCTTDEAIKIELLFEAPFVHPSVMMRTSLVSNLMYDKAWEKAEDYDLWERAARAGWRMANVPEILLMYRKHDSQISKASISRQLNLTAEIRKRYVSFLANTLGIKLESMMEIACMNAPVAKPDMDLVDEVFGRLLHLFEGKAKDEILGYAERLYLNMAAHSNTIIFRWCKLNELIGSHVPVTTKLKFWLLRFLKLRYTSRFCQNIEKLYALLAR